MKRLMLSICSIALIGQQFFAQTAAKPFSVWIAESEIARNGAPWKLENAPAPKWSYSVALDLQSIVSVSDFTGNKKFYEWVKPWGDTMVNANGDIRGYKIDEYNIDQVNGGKLLFMLYHKTNDPKYLKAIQTLRNQMKTHPRTSEGGFWHKQVYANQMWLDGLYMGTPFLAQYAKEQNEPELFKDIINQYVVIAKHTYDSKTGLFYHGWDESKTERWANKETGCSPNFWGRSLGWYALAMVDAMDFIPENHPDRTKVIELMNKVAVGIERWQDAKSGLWYQVIDQGSREGNYLEASASSMFTYFMFKAVRKGYIDKKYLTVAQKGYDGIVNSLIRKNDDGTITLTKCCMVAGLGGKGKYRDGSFEYYISEKIIDNDTKAVGPFMYASIEAEMVKK